MTTRTTTAYKPAGTETFRLASSKLFREYGCNIQNWDKSYRHLIIPDDGKELAQIDQAGAEALIVAYECVPGNLRNLFLNGIKPHVYVALKIFFTHWVDLVPSAVEIADLSIIEIKKHPDWKILGDLIKNDSLRYFLGKKTCHASNYGMGANTFSSSVLLETDGAVAVSSVDAAFFIGTYHNIFPEVRQWHETVKKTLRNENKTLRNLFGYPRIFTSDYGEDMFKKAFAFVPQSTVGTITNLAFTEIQERIVAREFPGLDLLQNGHDSILLQAPTALLKDYVTAVRVHLERDLISTRGSKYKMKTEVGYGKDWGHLYET